MEEVEADESQDMDMAVEHDGSLHHKSGTQIVGMNEYVFMLWTEERRQFDVKMQQLYEKLDPKSRRKRKMKRGTDADFMDHLLDVHRSWCKACRPGIDLDKNNRILHMKKGDCVDQATQTMPTMPGIFSQPPKPMPRLAKIQPSGLAQTSATESIDGGMGIGKRKLHDPPTKGPNIKVIKIIKSKAGLLRQETRMSEESLKNLMHTSSDVGGLTFKAAQPLQEVGGSSSSLPLGSYVVKGKHLLSSTESQGRPIKLLQVVPTKKGHSNMTPSSLASGVVTLAGTVPSSSNPSTTSSVPYIAGTMSFNDIYGENFPGTSSAETIHPAESTEAHRVPGVVFGQTECVDEDDNDEDDFYDDGNMTFDDEKEPVDHSKKQSEDTEHPDFVVTVKEEPLSDTEETLDLVHADKEESSFDQMLDQEAGSEPGREEEEEEEEETEDEEEEEEDDGEVDYEALERQDPSYEPPSLKSQHSKKRGKYKSRSDQPGTSADLSGGDKDSRESSGSDWNIESSGSEWDIESSGSEWNVESEEDTDEDFDEELEDKPPRRQKKRLVPCVCPLCSATCKSKTALINHMQTHLPLDKGWESIKEAIKSIEDKFGNKYTKEMGWCEECKKLCPRYKRHCYMSHNASQKTLCTLCGKVIKNAKLHQLTHLEVDESDYVQCPKCPSRFKHKYYLQTHTRKVHSNKPRPQKTFKCSTCGKVLKNMKNLKRHEVIHSDVKPFPCSECELSFTQASNLKIHMRQHTGHQPYACELCEKAFTNKVSLKNHKKKLHGIDWWKDRESLDKK